MLSKQITYYDLNGGQVTETLHFNLTTVEIARLKLQISPDKDLAEHIQELVESEDFFRLIMILADLALEAYGEKSVDGKRFVKNAEIRENFKNSVAYAEFLELVSTDATVAEEFGSKVLAIPKNQSAERAEAINNRIGDVIKMEKQQTTHQALASEVAEVPNFKEMSDEELIAHFRKQ